jgi:DNA polymerase III sliding clamp (beta) subunit (PCNA family)
MRFSIRKDTLQKALDVASLAVTKDAGVITSSVLFEIEEGDLTLWSTDRRVMTKVPTTMVPETLQGEGSFTVEAGRLTQWVKSVFEEEIAVEVDTDGVVMTCGDATGHFVSLDADAFPDFKNRLEGKTKLFDSDPTTFINALKFAKPFIGDETSNNATANNFQVAELRGRDMMATDSCILSLFKVTTDENSDILADYIESGQKFKVSKDEIKKVIDFLNKTCDLRFSVSKTDLFLIESDDGSIFGYSEPLYDLPDIPGIPVDLTEPEIWKLNKKKLQSAVKALTATADPDDVVLEVEVSGAEGVQGVLKLSMKDALEKHDSVFKIPVVREKSSGESVSFKVNHQFLTDPLGLYDDEDVYIGVNATAEASTKYVKLHEVTEQGNVRVALITLRLDL